MVERFANRARGTLNAGISGGDLSLTLGLGQGALFPALTAGDYFWGVLEEGSLYAPTKREVVKATARSGDVVTIERGQQGTAAQAFVLGARFENRITGTALSEIRDRVIEPSHTARVLPPLSFWGARASGDDPWGFWGVATPGTPTLAATGQLAGQYRSRYTAAANTNAVGIRAAAADSVWRGNAAGRGGFRFDNKLGMEVDNNNTRLFVGLVDSPSAFLIQTTDPGAATAQAVFGIGWNLASITTDNLRLFHGAGAGSVTDVDTTISRASMLTDIIHFLVRALANGSGIRVIVKNLNTGAGIDQTITTNIPPATTFLQWQASIRGTGAANSIQLSSIGSVGRPMPW